MASPADDERVDDLSAEDAETKTAAETAAADDTGEKSPSSMLDALMAVGKTDDGDEGAPASETGEEGKDEAAPDGAAGKAEAKPDEQDDDDSWLTKDEFKSLSPKTQKRIKKLSAEKRELSTQVEQYKPAAEQMQGLFRYIEDAGLVTEEVNTGFEIMRLMKNDPFEAYKKLKPYMDQLQQIVGDVLPDDLKAEVDDGRIAEERARELAQSRSREQLRAAESVRAAAAAEARQRQETQRTSAQRVATAVSEWESKWSASDPDYRLKAPRVMEKMKLAVLERNGAPLSPDEALALAEKSRRAVEEELKAFQPRRRRIDPETGGAATRSTPEPRSLLEAMKQERDRMQGAA